jgi:ribosome biogenesis GTPase
LVSAYIIRSSILGFTPGLTLRLPDTVSYTYMESLRTYGWDTFFEEAWTALALERCVPARVLADFGSVLKVAAPDERTAEVSGRLTYMLAPHELPKVGDWVGVQLLDDGNALIEAVLPRRSEIARKAAGEKVQRQVMAANLDIVFIIQALDHDFSPERMQRYLFQLAASNIEPVLVLNKADKVADSSAQVAKVQALGLSYIVCSALTGDGVDQIEAAIKPGQTAALLGSSGVGKSTLINLLLGRAVQRTQEIREIDSKGRHTTTHRELFVLKTGGLVIDTPGIRELQLWGTEDELEETFEDIPEIAARCQFRNCRHTTEAGCAIREALASSELKRQHYDNYLKMKRELAHLATKTDAVAKRDRNKSQSKVLKQHYKDMKDSPKRSK